MGNKRSGKIGKGKRCSKVSKASIRAHQRRKQQEAEAREQEASTAGNAEISTHDVAGSSRAVGNVNIGNTSGQSTDCVPIFSTPTKRNNGCSNNICSTANKTLPIFSPGTTEIYNTIAEGFPNNYDFSSHLPYAIERSTETETSDDDEVIRLVDVMHFSKEILKIEKRDATIECQSEGSPDLNTNAVWGSLNAGIGHSQLQDVFSYLEVPIMCADKYKDIVTDLNETWQEKLNDYMIATGKIEKELAIARGDVDPDGVPFITVIVDGGWCRRSFGHNYNANGGVAVIIGAETQKLLHYGVLCRNCATCSTAERLSKEPPPHDCSKNYDGPSTAMEWNIIVSGFNRSEEVHGLRYKFFIADGDASVLHQVRLQCPYGRSVRKIECANHKVRCITSNLHKITANTSLNVEARKILKSRIPRLSKGARSAIRYCHQNNDTVDDLRFDFENLPHHVFGDHSKCRSYIREHCKINEENLIPFLQEKRVYHEIKSVLKSLINNAHSLIKNKTSNMAENVFSLTTKTCNGKRVDYTRSNQYETRVVVAALNFQRGHFWSLSPYKAVHGVSPGPVLKNAMRKKDNKRKANAAKNLSKKFKSKAPSKQADKHYGAVTEIIDTIDGVAKPDLDESDMQQKIAEKLESLQVTVEMRDRIERLTIGQSDNPHWHDARENRITASEFSSVVDRRKATSSDLVRRLLYSTCKETEAMKYGKRNEHVAIQRFTQLTGLTVEECGIFIDLTHGFLGASPDGLIGEDGLVEVKCIPSVKDIGLRAAAGDTKHKRYGNFCLCINEKGQLQLKPRHKYRRQIQGQLNITQRDFCYFIVMCDKDKPMHIEKIERNNEIWEQEMLPNLNSFYKQCMIQEIVDPRTCRGLPIREPASPYQQNPRKVAVIKKRKSQNSNNDLNEPTTSPLIKRRKRN